jgi:hypothetical protein
MSLLSKQYLQLMGELEACPCGWANRDNSDNEGFAISLNKKNNIVVFEQSCFSKFPFGIC